MFKRKPKCLHDWKILHGLHELEGDNDVYWEHFHGITSLRAFCKTCGVTDTWKIANWKMSDEEVRVYITEVYGQ